MKISFLIYFLIAIKNMCTYEKLDKEQGEANHGQTNYEKKFGTNK